MTCPFIQINHWSVLLAFLAVMLLGALWYSPLLFGTEWLKLVDHRNEEIGREEMSRSMWLSTIPAFVSVLVLALLLTFSKVHDLGSALLLASAIALGFVAPSMFNLVIFEGRSSKLVLINLGYTLLSLNAAALILTLWP